MQTSNSKGHLQYFQPCKPYNRIVSVLTLIAAVLLLSLSIVFEKRIRIIADGVMLGGLFTLLYSLGRGIASGYSAYVFVMVSIGLATVLFLGYHRFVKAPTTNNTPKQ